MLNLHQVTKQFRQGVKAVDEVSVALGAGVVGLIGHNGAGKTTLMQMIVTLTRPTSGDIFFDGKSITQSPQTIRARLGYLPQDFGVYDNISAREFLSYFAALKGVSDRQRVEQMLALVNLHEQADRAAAGFSGGMRQRLGIAQALINNPDILIVDEPTAGLDPAERLRFRNLLNEIGFNKLVLVSTHIVSDVENMADHLLVMDKGKLVASAAPEFFLQQAQGKIWSAVVEREIFEQQRQQWKLVHTQRHAEGVEIRVIANEKPVAHAQAVAPSLEESLMMFNSQLHGMPL